MDTQARSLHTINQPNTGIWQDLNPDVLREIYSWTMPYEMPNGLLQRGSVNGSLSALRLGTHVCQHWRNILLDSPLLWGQCVSVNLNPSQAEYIKWLDTVMFRTRNSPLTITGVLRSLPPSDLPWHFLDILHENWQRVRSVSVSVQIIRYFGKVRWINAMAQLLSRPTDIMQHFSIDIRLRPLPHDVTGPRLKPAIPLFSRHAPALQTLSLSMLDSHFPITIAAPLYSLRVLYLSKVVHTTDVELLTMCMQMPMLERLTLALFGLSISSTDLRPKLPRLNFIDIQSDNLTVYEAFLGRINPNNACAIHLTTNFPAWPSHTNYTVGDVDNAFCAVRRHLDLLFSSQDKVLPELRIRLTQNNILVTSSDPYPFELCWAFTNLSLRISRGIIEVIFTHLSVVTYPRQISQLDIFHNFQPPGLPDPSYLLGLLISMRTVTSLAITANCLIYIQDIVANADLLPCLETLIIYSEIGRIQDIIPFLLHRHRRIPIRRLDLTGFSQLPIEYACGMLDMFCGLELVWFPDMQGRKETYICGSGGLQYAKRAPYYVTHTV